MKKARHDREEIYTHRETMEDSLIEKLTIENNSYLKENICLKEQIVILESNIKYLEEKNTLQEKHLEFKSNQLKKHLQIHKKKILSLKRSYSFRLSQLIVESFSNPKKNMIKFPKRFVELLFEFFFLR